MKITSEEIKKNSPLITAYCERRADGSSRKTDE